MLLAVLGLRREGAPRGLEEDSKSQGGLRILARAASSQEEKGEPAGHWLLETKVASTFPK